MDTLQPIRLVHSVFATLPLILAPALGRWSILLLTATLPYFRLSASVIEGMGKLPLFWGTATIA
jgi:hypothetical protein